MSQNISEARHSVSNETLSAHPSTSLPQAGRLVHYLLWEDHLLKRTRLILSIINLYFDNIEEEFLCVMILPVHYFSLLNSCDRLITQARALGLALSPPTSQEEEGVASLRRQIALNNEFVQN